MSELIFNTKEIVFEKKKRKIILQNQNGPCPLISIINALILRGNEEINRLAQKYNSVKGEQLAHFLGNILIEMSEKEGKKKSPDKNFIKTISDSLEVITKMTKGMDLNVKFNNIFGYEYTPEIGVFDLLKIRLAHGWVIDIDNLDNVDIFGDSTYNEVIEKQIFMEDLLGIPHEKKKLSKEKKLFNKNLILEMEHPKPSRKDSLLYDPEEEEEKKKLHKKYENVKMSSLLKKYNAKDTKELCEKLNKEDREKILKEGKVIKQFLKEYASQLTYYGLELMHSILKEKELIVFFQNNHFSTVHKRDGLLYRLVTDEGYVNENNVVWERITDNQYLNGQFKLIAELKKKKGSELSDFQLAKKLAEEDLKKNNPSFDSDLEFAKKLQEEENQRRMNEVQKGMTDEKRKGLSNDELLAHKLQEEETEEFKEKFMERRKKVLMHLAKVEMQNAQKELSELEKKEALTPLGKDPDIPNEDDTSSTDSGTDDEEEEKKKKKKKKGCLLQ